MARMQGRAAGASTGTYDTSAIMGYLVNTAEGKAVKNIFRMLCIERRTRNYIFIMHEVAEPNLLSMRRKF